MGEKIFFDWSSDTINYYGHLYATKKQELVLVESKTKRYVFNCAKREELVEFVKRKL